MVLVDNTTQSVAANFLIAIGVTLVAPVILPVVTAGIRPLAKLIIKGGDNNGQPSHDRRRDQSRAAPRSEEASYGVNP
jgi:hypothetical protein